MVQSRGGGTATFLIGLVRFLDITRLDCKKKVSTPHKHTHLPLKRKMLNTYLGIAIVWAFGFCAEGMSQIPRSVTYGQSANSGCKDAMPSGTRLTVEKKNTRSLLFLSHIALCHCRITNILLHYSTTFGKLNSQSIFWHSGFSHCYLGDLHWEGG